MEKIDRSWLGNLHYIEENGADFFVTGGSQAVMNLDLRCIPGKGVNLSGANQSLQQGYQTAKHVFEYVKPNTVKFVLIGLSLYSAFYNAESKEFDILTGQVTTAEDVDLNYERVREIFKQKFSEGTATKLVRDDLLSDEELKEISQVLGDYAGLCIDNGAIPVFVTLPVEPVLKKLITKNFLKRFRENFNVIAENYKSVFIDLLDSKFAAECFYGKSLLSSDGAVMASYLLCSRLYLKKLVPLKEICEMNADYFNILSKYFLKDYKKLTHHVFCKMASADFKRLSKTLPAEKCKDLMARVFSEMTYNHLANLSNMLPKEDYNDIAMRIFKMSAEKIRRKKKIKVGFFFEHSSKWCGDELYQLFERDPRFEPTAFFHGSRNEITRKEFLQDLDRFKSRGLNVFGVKKSKDVPVQDILIQSSPYNNTTPSPFRIINLKLTTLLAYIPYAHTVSVRSKFRDSSFFRVLWKMFFSSTISLEEHEKACKVGMPRGLYSGYPKMDVFFRKDVCLKFDWKMTRPDSKKIIWAPHHSLGNKEGSSLGYGTFQYNYRFLYEFAKTHPEISWIVKPHPLLFVAAVEKKVFPSIDAFKEYLQKWDELPNAQVYLGAYYQAIFATSDGLIQDCGSFVAEYQYVDKPMIYLTRKGGIFNDLGNEILKAAYLVDAKDLEAIAAMIQRVFIEGDDYKAAERKAVFDKYLNYPKSTGMLASEFIYRNISEELRAVE